MPTHVSPFGPGFFSTSSSAETSATGMNTQMKYTPSVITEPGLAMSQKKRSGLCRPASASNINMTRPIPRKIGAMIRPATRIFTLSGYFTSTKAEVRKAPADAPARNRYHAIIGPQTMVHHLT